MAYEKIQFNPQAAPGISADRLNHMQTQYDEAAADLTAHLAETMPHRFTDGATTYRWGLAVIDGVVNMVYEEVV